MSTTPSRSPMLVLRATPALYFAWFMSAVPMVLLAASYPRYFWWLVVVSIFVLAAIIRRSTTVTPEAITVRTLFSRREYPWESIQRLVTPRSGTIAFETTSGQRVFLPRAHYAHLEVIATASGGHVTLPRP